MTTLTKWKAGFSIGFLRALEHRFDLFTGLFGAVFPIVVQLFLWTAIYNSTGKSTEVYGYTFSQMIAYVIIAALVNKVVNTGVENVINEDIHTGGIAKYLIKPVNYIGFRFMQTTGQQIPSLISVLLLSLTTSVVLHFTIDFTTSPAKMLLFVIALLFGVILNFFIFLLISMSAFWITEAGSFFMTVQVVIMVASGGVCPITVLGDTFVSVMEYLPFIYTTYFPIQIITGPSALSDIAFGLLIQICWITVLSLFSAFVWRKGIRHYVAVGG